jgi:hypothetical protein
MAEIEQEKKFTPLQESLLILAALRNQIRWALLTMVPEGRVKDENLKFTVCNYIQVLLCSFLEEWSALERLGRDERLRTTLKISSPALDRIKRWRGLPKIRSMLLAHGHRNKEGSPAWAWEVFEKYNAPTAYAETILLGNCARLATEVLLIRYKSEYKEAVKLISGLKQTIKDRGIRTVGEIDIEINKVKTKMLKIAGSDIVFEGEASNDHTS